MSDDSKYLLTMLQSKKYAEGNSVTLPSNLDIEHRNKASGSLSGNPDEVGSKFKDFSEKIMSPILEYYKLDLILLDYGYERETNSVSY